MKIPDDKKFYVLSNLIKSAVLLSYSPIAAHALVQVLYQLSPQPGRPARPCFCWPACDHPSVRNPGTKLKGP